MNTNPTNGSLPHAVDPAAEKDFEKTEVTLHRLFELDEDLLPDPLDELLGVTLLSEEHLPNEENPNSGITPEILRKDRFERARYGVSRRDMMDFGFDLMAIMATGFRKLRNATDNPEEKETFNKLINGCIALNERGAMNDMSFFKDKEKNAAEQERWNTHWAEEVAKFQEVLDAEWLNISPAHSPFTWNRGGATAIVSRLEGRFTYDEKKEYLSDPITPAVPVEERNEHLRQRAYEGYSDWDLKYFRTYLVWILAQACIFYASTDAHGFPMSEDFPTFEAYSEFLIEFADGLLRGEANMCFDRTMIFNLRESDSQDYAKSISLLTRVIPGLWD